jgi:hypothetical protein
MVLWIAMLRVEIVSWQTRLIIFASFAMFYCEWENYKIRENRRRFAIAFAVTFASLDFFAVGQIFFLSRIRQLHMPFSDFFSHESLSSSTPCSYFRSPGLINSGCLILPYFPRFKTTGCSFCYETPSVAEWTSPSVGMLQHSRLLHGCLAVKRRGVL